MKKELLSLLNPDEEKQQQRIPKIFKILQKNLIPIKEESNQQPENP